jgi:hypothetical protein
MLGGINLFTSHFVMGCTESIEGFTKTKTDEIVTLHNWLKFKDNDPFMDKYHSKKTQYVCFLRLIPIDDFKGILSDLARHYKKQYPFSTKSDFIKNIFETTIFEIRELINWIEDNRITWLSEPPNENVFSFYTVYDSTSLEYFDFAILSKYDIEHYKQYYLRILSIIDECSFFDSENRTKEPKQLSENSPIDYGQNFSITELINYLGDGKISVLQALNKVLQFTEKDPYRIELFLYDWNHKLVSIKAEYEQKIKAFLEVYFDSTQSIDIETYPSFEQMIYRICKSKGFKSFQDLPKKKQYPDDSVLFFHSITFTHEDVFYSFDFGSADSLTRHLLQYTNQSRVSPTNATNNPFKDNTTAELFEYIVKNWNYNAATKWGYIWNYFIQRGNGKMTFKIDYESYLIERGLITKGKPNYEACSSSKRYNQLDELKRQYLENLDLK